MGNTTVKWCNIPENLFLYIQKAWQKKFKFWSEKSKGTSFLVFFAPKSRWKCDFLFGKGGDCQQKTSGRIRFLYLYQWRTGHFFITSIMHLIGLGLGSFFMLLPTRGQRSLSRIERLTIQSLISNSQPSNVPLSYSDSTWPSLLNFLPLFSRTVKNARLSFFITLNGLATQTHFQMPYSSFADAFEILWITIHVVQ